LHTNGHAHSSPDALESEVANPNSLRFIGFINIPTEASADVRFGQDFYKARLPSPSQGNNLYVKLIERDGKPLSAILYEGPKIKDVPKFHVVSKTRLYDILYRLKAKAKNLYVIK
jgi:hypothetical protein